MADATISPQGTSNLKQILALRDSLDYYFYLQEGDPANGTTPPLEPATIDTLKNQGMTAALAQLLADFNGNSGDVKEIPNIFSAIKLDPGPKPTLKARQLSEAVLIDKAGRGDLEGAIRAVKASSISQPGQRALIQILYLRDYLDYYFFLQEGDKSHPQPLLAADTVQTLRTKGITEALRNLLASFNTDQDEVRAAAETLGFKIDAAKPVLKAKELSVAPLNLRFYSNDLDQALCKLSPSECPTPQAVATIYTRVASFVSPDATENSIKGIFNKIIQDTDRAKKVEAYFIKLFSHFEGKTGLNQNSLYRVSLFKGLLAIAVKLSRLDPPVPDSYLPGVAAAYGKYLEIIAAVKAQMRPASESEERLVDLQDVIISNHGGGELGVAAAFFVLFDNDDKYFESEAGSKKFAAGLVVILNDFDKAYKFHRALYRYVQHKIDASSPSPERSPISIINENAEQAEAPASAAPAAPPAAPAPAAGSRVLPVEAKFGPPEVKGPVTFKPADYNAAGGR